MIASALLFATTWMAATPTPTAQGTITGIVVNASHDNECVADSQVLLRVHVDGQFVPVAETTSDQRGRFRFDDLPLDADGLYLPGANRRGIHYPGPRIPLSRDHSHARVKLLVCDTTSQPSPLVVTDYRVVIDARPGVLTVTETMLIDNPTSLCYIGEAATENGQPVTLRLAIPPDFERTTFHKEFFGRQFSMSDGRLVTGVPWPPGKRELVFTYVLPNNQTGYLWRRPLDLPCQTVRLTVRVQDHVDVSANVARTVADQPGDISFGSTDTSLPAGYPLEITLGQLPVPAMVYGPPVAAIMLVGLVAGVTIQLARRSRRPQRHKQRASQTAAVADERYCSAIQ